MLGVHPELSGVRVDPTKGFANVIDSRRIRIFGGKAVIDAEPRIGRFLEKAEEGIDVSAAVPRFPTASMNHHYSGNRVAGHRETGIQYKGLGGRSAESYLVPVEPGSGRISPKHTDSKEEYECKDTWRGPFRSRWDAKKHLSLIARPEPDSQSSRPFERLEWERWEIYR